MTETQTHPGTHTALPTAEEIALDWATSPRWHGIARTYSAEDVVRLRGTVHEEHTLARRGAAHPAGRGQAVHAGHLDVEDDQVGLVGRRLLQRVRAVHRDLRVVPLEGEAALECFAHRRLVVDDQDALGVTVAFG